MLREGDSAFKHKVDRLISLGLLKFQAWTSDQQPVTKNYLLSGTFTQSAGASTVDFLYNRTGSKQKQQYSDEVYLVHNWKGPREYFVLWSSLWW